MAQTNVTDYLLAFNPSRAIGIIKLLLNDGRMIPISNLPLNKFTAATSLLTAPNKDCYFDSDTEILYARGKAAIPAEMALNVVDEKILATKKKSGKRKK